MRSSSSEAYFMEIIVKLSVKTDQFCLGDILQRHSGVTSRTPQQGQGHFSPKTSD